MPDRAFVSEGITPGSIGARALTSGRGWSAHLSPAALLIFARMDARLCRTEHLCPRGITPAQIDDRALHRFDRRRRSDVRFGSALQHNLAELYEMTSRNKNFWQNEPAA
jgi:hypothetical protein